MIRSRCPICGRAVEGPTLDALPHFPFCSGRCRTIDQARWADGDYQIPGASAPGPAEGDDASPT